MGKHIKIVPMKNRKGFSINFKSSALMFALLSKPRYTILQNENSTQIGYFIAINRLMLGIGFYKKQYINKN